MRNAALGAHVMKGEEKKWHEGRGVPSRLPVESQRLCNCKRRRARVGNERPSRYFFHVANDALATIEYQ